MVKIVLSFARLSRFLGELCYDLLNTKDIFMRHFNSF